MAQTRKYYCVIGSTPSIIDLTTIQSYTVRTYDQALRTYRYASKIPWSKYNEHHIYVYSLDISNIIYTVACTAPDTTEGVFTYLNRFKDVRAPLVQLTRDQLLAISGNTPDQIFQICTYSAETTAEYIQLATITVTRQRSYYIHLPKQFALAPIPQLYITYTGNIIIPGTSRVAKVFFTNNETEVYSA